MRIKEGLFRLVAVAGVTTAMSLPVAAVAQTDYPGGPPPQVLGEDLSRTPEGLGHEGPEVLGQSVSGGGEGLPVTGGDVAGLAVIGLGAITAGTVLVRRSRVRPS